MNRTQWTNWNVSLWIYNDETTYRLMQHMVTKSPDLSVAASLLQMELPMHTPDGADYTYMAIRDAIADDHAEYWDN